MLLKCCTQYVSDFEKLSSGHRTEKSQFSFQSQRRAESENVKLYSFCMLVRWCSKCFKIGFNSTWTENFQMYKLSFKKTEKPEIKLSTLLGSQRKQGNSSKAFTSASLTTLKPLIVWITTNSGKSLKRWEYLTTLSVSWETCIGVKKQYLIDGAMDWFKIGKGVCQGCILSPCLFNLYAEYIKRNAGLNESQAEIKIAGRNINNLRYADDITLMAEIEEELKKTSW